jgi:hypothetical protein
MGLEGLSVLSSGTEHEHQIQNDGMHQSHRWCFSSMTASLGDLVMATVLAIKSNADFSRAQRSGALARMDRNEQTKL